MRGSVTAFGPSVLHRKIFFPSVQFGQIGLIFPNADRSIGNVATFQRSPQFPHSQKIGFLVVSLVFMVSARQAGTIDSNGATTGDVDRFAPSAILIAWARVYRPASFRFPVYPLPSGFQ